MRCMVSLCLSIGLLIGSSAMAIGTDFLGKDGDAYIAGILGSPQGPRKGPIVVHLNADGSVDTNYGTNGVVRPNFLADYRISLPMHFVVSRKGEVTVSPVNCTIPPFLCTQYLARLDEQGQSDTSFGNPATPGFTVLGQAAGVPGARVFEQNKKFVTYYFTPTAQLSRFNKDGILDTSFGTNGHIINPGAAPLTIQRDKKIIMSIGNQATGTNLITRLLPDGQPDPSFSNSANVPFLSTSAAAQQKDGKLVIGSLFGIPTLGTEPSMTIHRLNADGTNDTSFGTNGTATLPSTTFDDVTEIAFQRHGKIVVFGSREDANGVQSLLMARFTKTGQLDQTFGVNGVVTLTFTVPVGGDGSFTPLHMNTMKDGSIVAYGTVVVNNAAGRQVFGVARFDKDGGLDTTYGNQGIVLFDPIP